MADIFLWSFFGALVIGFIFFTLFIRIIVVNEGTAIVFKLMGGYCATVMQFNGHIFDENGFIMSGYDNSFPTHGGSTFILRARGWVFFYSLFVKPAQSTEHSNITKADDKYTVFLNERQEEFTLDKAETKSPENVALNIKYLVIWRIVNPYLYLFAAPRDAKEQLAKSLNSALRGWVKCYTEEEVQLSKGNGIELWKKICCDSGSKSIIEALRADWGIEIVKNSIIINNIVYDSEFQAALKAKKQAQLSATAFASETAGREIAMVSEWLGISVEDLQNELRQAILKDPENGFESWLKKYPVVNKNWNLIQQQQLGVKPILFGNADGSQSDPLISSLALLISLAKGNVPGLGVPGGKGKREITGAEAEKNLREKGIL